ncbi:hypothetical protein CHU_0045 [Cytophaga hutchinsonii ATCC 33406]|uniref:Uncharacterized protein n=1 Tax=Cytophaga hutchinsonii (strain ATCC 33406 / DSM 1761 / CIP 103989 / NBRC 15051 / NCIMB 9469 / D465) TaxID=269798 RepID=A0A6N4SM53_CYTH3|nr:hypothetical protein CHU_0045 [Cytophaga hutchinsonii ATCC 33406]
MLENIDIRNEDAISPSSLLVRNLLPISEEFSTQIFQYHSDQLLESENISSRIFCDFAL